MRGVCHFFAAPRADIGVHKGMGGARRFVVFRRFLDDERVDVIYRCPYLQDNVRRASMATTWQDTARVRCYRQDVTCRVKDVRVIVGWSVRGSTATRCRWGKVTNARRAGLIPECDWCVVRCHRVSS